MIFAALFGCFFGFFVEAWLGKSGSPAARLTLSSSAIQEMMANAAGSVTTFVCIIAILQIGHEYRYNTIMYTLTASSSRLKVFLSKLVTLSVFSLVACAFTIILTLGAYILGLKLKGAELPVQQIDLVPVLLRLGAYFLAYGVFGFLLGVIVRSLIASIAILFILPTMIEPLLGLLLRDNSKYLPMTALDGITGSSLNQQASSSFLQPNSALLLTVGYLLILGVVGWILFARRDAN
jgi:ABC-type transport system involved in multi-copper enzyme maturation permease subunit